MRQLSLNARLSPDAPTDPDLEIVLLRITHADLDAPVRLSTDPTTRLAVDPIGYGTRSTWPDNPADPYLFVLMSAPPPDDLVGQVGGAEITLTMVDAAMASPFRATIERATVDMAVVKLGDPDTALVDHRGLQMVVASGTSDVITLTIEGKSIWTRAFPAGRMTRWRTPALFRGA